MNVKKYIFIAIGIFFIIIVGAMCISARFDFSNITAAPSQFIEDFFINWSPALSAVATFIVAILALLAIYEGRRSHKLAILDQQYSKIEEWISDNAEAIHTAKHLVKLYILEDEHKKYLKKEYHLLEEKKKRLEHKKDKGKAEILKDINEKLIKINKDIITTNERIISFAKKGMEELVKVATKVARSDIIIKPLIHSIGDAELLKYYENYTDLINKSLETLKKTTAEDSFYTFREVIDEIENAIQNLPIRVSLLRKQNS